jgi:hypothetical protein
MYKAVTLMSNYTAKDIIKQPMACVRTLSVKNKLRIH